jgi:hypothetical protein
MTHYSRLAAALLALSLPLACDKASDDQVRTTGAEVKANKEIKAANDQATREDLAAKAAEDRTISAANSDFAKLRADYRTQTTKNLREVDHQVTALEERSTAGVDARLQQIHAKRAQVDADLQALSSASESTWDAQKASLDKELSELNALVEGSAPGWYGSK